MALIHSSEHNNTPLQVDVALTPQQVDTILSHSDNHSKFMQHLPLQVDTALDHSKWMQYLPTASGCSIYPQQVDTALDHSKWMQP